MADDIPPLPAHCEPSNPYLVLLSSFFNTCLPTPMALLSTTFGLLSIASWLFAQMPQIIKNQRRRSVEGLSLGFLAVWLAGDVCNFLGAVWTRQMWFQQVVGAYYVAVDCVLVGQWVWFSRRGGSEVVDGVEVLVEVEEDSVKKRPASSRRSGSGVGRSLIVTISMLCRVASASPMGAVAPMWTLPEDPNHELLGRLLAWISTGLYLASRLPQLMLNFKRRSTSGLAISLFVAAFFGNLFYSLSLLCNPLGHQDYPPYGGGGIAGPEGSEAAEWWGRSIPFFLGASGVLSMDALIGWQWLCWGDESEGMWRPWRRWMAEKEPLLVRIETEAEIGYGTNA